MWTSSILEKSFGLRRSSGASTILCCKVDPESLRRFRAIAKAKGRSTCEHLREIVFENLAEWDSVGRNSDTFTTEITALRSDFTSALNSLHREISMGSLGWSFPQRATPGTTAQKSTMAKKQIESDTPPVDTIDDGWQRRDRRRSKWGRWQRLLSQRCPGMKIFFRTGSPVFSERRGGKTGSAPGSLNGGGRCGAWPVRRSLGEGGSVAGCPRSKGAGRTR